MLTALLACAHARPPEQEALLKRGDCAELLRAADQARAGNDAAAAAELAGACTPDALDALAARSQPVEALLWCGRFSAANPGQPGCSAGRTAELTAKLSPHFTIGPPDSATPEDPLLAAALAQVGAELNLSFDANDPDVIIGRLTISIDHQTSYSTAQAVDAKGAKRRVPATQHRFLARAEAEVELQDKTRVLRASDEARDYTWDAAPRLVVAARAVPQVPSDQELKTRAAVAWLRVLARSLAVAPPETVDVTDAKGCLAYGLSLNASWGDPLAAAHGRGDARKVTACEHLLGEPAGAGIPVP